LEHYLICLGYLFIYMNKWNVQYLKSKNDVNIKQYQIWTEKDIEHSAYFFSKNNYRSGEYYKGWKTEKEFDHFTFIMEYYE
jgi:hypothetical protein